MLHVWKLQTCQIDQWQITQICYVQFEVDISNYIGYIELFNTFDLQFGLLSVANLWGYHSENHIVKALISECGGWGAQSVR
jgi:hypothetical protein